MVLYVGNINYNLSEDELKDVFERYGKVDSVKIVTDKDNGRSKGFAFIDMVNDQDAELAKNELDGSDLGGRNMRVNYATNQN
ncbi:MAG: RNA-binding protein [Bacteroidales bacterium]|nr:RNA-binding protein [Bacteroidales bacterium]